MKRILFLIFGMMLCLSTFAQELKVKSFSLAETDISAQTQPRKDLNDEPCALVKVQFVGDILDVEGNVIKPLVKKSNETWAYMTHGSQQMKVLTKDYLPIMVDFSNYGISQVEKNKTYVLVLIKPVGGAESVMQQSQTLIIRYTPSTATVLVDNKMVRGSNGVAKTTLPVGQHSYIVACDGYESEEGMVKLKASAPSNLQITLMKESIGAGIVNQQQSENQQSSNTYVASSSNNSSGSPSVASGSNAISIPVKNGISIEMVKVEAGTFMMGATSEMQDPYRWEKPVHQVTLTNDYYMGKYEVTQALWEAVMGSNPSYFKGDNLPVETVSWNDCQEFISKLNSLTGRKFRLSTEAEWEYAARGGKKSRSYQYSGSSNISDVAWYDGNSGS
ncbi:SUMF1/EgtB/PvdO family nonheme iron enzyme, partial [Segatella hominis]|uniref:SUMF1/EgtB/PvdO family nonheme iron enzyme n=1 Tax=Segatella hominis TaxID=2518605 RepID=UPI003AB98125